MTQSDSCTIFRAPYLSINQFPPSKDHSQGSRTQRPLVSARLLIAGRIAHFPFGGKSWFLPGPELGETATLTCRFFLFHSSLFIIPTLSFLTLIFLTLFFLSFHTILISSSLIHPHH